MSAGEERGIDDSIDRSPNLKNEEVTSSNVLDLSHKNVGFNFFTTVNDASEQTKKGSLVDGDDDDIGKEETGVRNTDRRAYRRQRDLGDNFVSSGYSPYRRHDSPSGRRHYTSRGHHYRQKQEQYYSSNYRKQHQIPDEDWNVDPGAHLEQRRKGQQYPLRERFQRRQGNYHILHSDYKGQDDGHHNKNARYRRYGEDYDRNADEFDNSWHDENNNRRNEKFYRAESDRDRNYQSVSRNRSDGWDIFHGYQHDPRSHSDCWEKALQWQTSKFNSSFSDPRPLVKYDVDPPPEEEFIPVVSAKLKADLLLPSSSSKIVTPASEDSEMTESVQTIPIESDDKRLLLNELRSIEAAGKLNK